MITETRETVERLEQQLEQMRQRAEKSEANRAAAEADALRWADVAQQHRDERDSARAAAETALAQAEMAAGHLSEIQAALGDCPPQGHPSAIRITSLRAEVEVLRARCIQQNVAFIKGAPHDEIDGCPTYCDGCNCTVESLVHNIYRAQAAEAEATKAKAEARAAGAEVERLRDALRAELVDAQDNERAGKEAHAGAAALRAALESLSVRCPFTVGEDEQVVAALATDAGEALLERLRKAERERDRLEEEFGSFTEHMATLRLMQPRWPLLLRACQSLHRAWRRADHERTWAETNGSDAAHAFKRVEAKLAEAYAAVLYEHDRAEAYVADWSGAKYEFGKRLGEVAAERDAARSELNLIRSAAQISLGVLDPLNAKNEVQPGLLVSVARSAVMERDAARSGHAQGIARLANIAAALRDLSPGPHPGPMDAEEYLPLVREEILRLAERAGDAMDECERLKASACCECGCDAECRAKGERGQPATPRSKLCHHQDRPECAGCPEDSTCEASGRGPKGAP